MLDEQIVISVPVIGLIIIVIFKFLDSFFLAFSGVKPQNKIETVEMAFDKLGSMAINLLTILKSDNGMQKAQEYVNSVPKPDQRNLAQEIDALKVYFAERDAEVVTMLTKLNMDFGDVEL